MNLRKNIFRILMILWMIVIFMFSARPGDVSTQDSNRVGRIVGKLFISGFEEWSEEKQVEFAKKADHVIRKTSHALEYTILGMLVMGAFIEWKKDRKLQLLACWLIGTVYAMSDEIHQLFVSGRSGQISDVCLDSAGVLLGVLLSFGAVKIYMNCKNKKESNILD